MIFSLDFEPWGVDLGPSVGTLLQPFLHLLGPLLRPFLHLLDPFYYGLFYTIAVVKGTEGVEGAVVEGQELSKMGLSKINCELYVHT